MLPRPSSPFALRPIAHSVPSVLIANVLLYEATTCFQLVSNPTWTGLDLEVVLLSPS